MFEVLEVSWPDFSNEMKVAKDLDDILAAHEKYLHSIVKLSIRMGLRSCCSYLRHLFVQHLFVFSSVQVLDLIFQGYWCFLTALTIDMSKGCIFVPHFSIC
ncbi:hypothetical protein ES319_D06G073700v1 [Gossypium barbadense]|uniref:Gamma tubulin complex component C-terminal domain-containing protein n=2 Tax=Gossypium TaxID=3633 RepID=A0A5J5QYL2_GOSBA|nr:hypothetical protein ES319_D06G073700v1 [Gossypium barbadense]TYG64065.1 hypothetical protein ES288_D06G079100v1 [Gossypium darwinii]